MSMIQALRPAVRAVLIGVIAAVLTAACNPSTAPTPGAPSPGVMTTGVRGLITAGPTCPVERPGQSACVRAVQGATIVAFDAADREVARVLSDATGAYFLRLAPGTYRIVPQPVEGLLGTAGEETVVVGAGTPTHLDLQYDTGIR